MEQNPLEKSNKTSLNEVSPIHKTRGLVITKKEQIKEIVESPVVKACEIFWDKNIQTYESSANSENIKSGIAWIRINFDTLSEANKKIALQYGQPYEETMNAGQMIELPISVKENETVDEISNKAEDIANSFKNQKAVWINGMTLQEHIDWLNQRYGKYPETATEIERLKQPGVWEKENTEKGKYFDPETQMVFSSEELFKKWKEGSESVIDNMDLKNKYSQEIIDYVWKRLAKEGISNADDVIGTRDSIKNEDFEKFWNSVKNEDIQNLMSAYKNNKAKQLENFETYKGKYQEGDFVPELGEMLSRDTSWWDDKISDLNSLLK
jgi:hypothetical protein